MIAKDYIIRRFEENDLAFLYIALKKIEGRRPLDEGYFERCWQEQEQDKRVVFIAISEDGVCGYIQLIFKPAYQMFCTLGIPEIQDLNVIPETRCKGVGNALVEYCEQYIHNLGGTELGIGVGLYKSYGAAQRLYARRGYLPDGMGIVYDNQPVLCGDFRPVDDQLCLKLVKDLTGIQ